MKGDLALQEGAYFSCLKDYLKSSQKFEEGKLIYYKEKTNMEMIWYFMSLESLIQIKEWQQVIDITDMMVKHFENFTKELISKRNPRMKDELRFSQFFLMRGRAFTKLKKYSEATSCFNKVIDNAVRLFARFASLLAKMVSAYERGQYKTYWKLLSRIVRENKSMKSFLRNLQCTVRITCPYLVY